MIPDVLFEEVISSTKRYKILRKVIIYHINKLISRLGGVNKIFGVNGLAFNFEAVA